MVVSLANGLAEKGHRVCIILPKNGNDTSFPINTVIKTIPFNYSKPYGFLLGNIFLYKHLKSMDIGISTYYPTAFSLYLGSLKLPRLRTFYLAQSYDPFFPEGKLSSIKRRFAEKSYGLPLRIITNSKWLQETILEKHQSRSDIVNPGIDREIFFPRSQKKQEKKKLVLTIGRSQKLKGLSDFVRSVELLIKRGYVVQPVIATHERLDIDSKIPFNIMRPKNDEELARIYSDADVYVHTSYTEGFGLPPLEAMACGTPAIVTASGGVREYAEHGTNSIVVSSRDVNALCESIVEVLYNPLLSKRLSLAGIETAKKFSWEKSIIEFLNIIMK